MSTRADQGGWTYRWVGHVHLVVELEHDELEQHLVELEEGHHDAEVHVRRHVLDVQRTHTKSGQTPPNINRVEVFAGVTTVYSV